MRTSKFLLFVFLVLGLAVRIIGLNIRPAGLTWDEAALGYNAYSLLKTGRDEHGQTAPLIFKSFGDYKPGLYIYFTVLPTAVLGLNEFSTRLPSAVFGTLTIAVIYVLIRVLFPNRRAMACWSLAVSAFNPWLIHFSRGAWEANLSLLLTVLAVTGYLWAVRQKSTGYFLAAALFFGLTFWTYQSAKLFTPLLLVSLIYLYRKTLNFRKIYLSLILFSLLLFPVVLNFTSQSGRLKVFSVFSYPRQPADVREIIRQDGSASPNALYYLFHSEILDQSRGILQRYLNHFSPRFMFTDGDWTNLRHSEYKHGYFYPVEVVVLVLGLTDLFRRRSRAVFLLLVWGLLAPLPSALSRDLVSGVRSLPLAVPLVMVISAGMARLWRGKAIRWLYPAAYLLCLIYYLEFYFFHAHFYAADQFVSAYKPAVTAIAAVREYYPEVYFTDQLGQPYIFVLYYLRYDPALFQRQAVRLENPSGDVGRVLSFAGFHFQPVFWPQLRGKTGAVFIGGQYELPEADLDFPGISRLAEIYYPNGSHALRVVGLN